MRNEQRFPVGTQYIPTGKNRAVHTVTDFLTTRNLAGEIVAVRYTATHDFLGQPITTYNIIETTIARGLLTPSK